MRFRPIHTAIFAAGALLASPALAADEYPLPLMAGAVAYSETSEYADYDSGWEDSYDTDGEVIYMDDLEEGEEWRSDDYYDEREETVIRREYRDAPPPPRVDTPAWGGDRRLGYGEGERQAWLAQCRSLMSRHDYAGDSCADYLARYESGSGGYEYSYGYGQQASHGCGSCNCGGSCGKGCGGGGGCGCTVSYRFAPMPTISVAQPPQKARRIITTEEWDEVVPGKAVRVIPPPARTVPGKIVPATPAPVKTIKPRYSK